MVNDDVAQAVAETVHGLLDRGGRVRDEFGERPLTPDRIAVGCAHVRQTAAVVAISAPRSTVA
jgi:hypothetical protein